MALLLKSSLFFVVLILISEVIYYENVEKINCNHTSLIDTTENFWVDSLIETMTLEEKVAQLIMIPVYANQNNWYVKKLAQQVEEYKIGGLIFMKGSPLKQVSILNTLQNKVKIPLMVAIDAEWGLAMRLDSTLKYPKAMIFGAVANDQTAYDFGTQLAEQMKVLGIHINFAPVVDVNNNAKNPVINVRSFGEDKRQVARKGLAFAQGLQDHNILAVAKHFPGHGDTDVDSHLDLPVINHSKDRMYGIELVPFENLIDNGVGGVMVGHLAVPSIENNSKRPASLSRVIVDSILRHDLNFKGLVFTDALNMKGVTKNFKPGQIEVEALLAGNDILLAPENIPLAIERILSAVNKGVISEQEIENRCRKVLKAKKWFGLDNYNPININEVNKILHNHKYDRLKAKVVEQSLTLIENQNSVLPFKNLDEKRIVVVQIGSGNSSVFKSYLNKYCRVDSIKLSANGIKKNIREIQAEIKPYSHIVISHTGINDWSKANFGIPVQEINLIKEIASLKPTVLCFFGNPYALSSYGSFDKFNAIVLGFSDDSIVQEKMAQGLFGGIPITGKLPVAINDDYTSGFGIELEERIRIGFSHYSDFGLHETDFYKVDSIVLDAISMKAIPGCQVLYARKGKIIYQKSFGNFTYNKSRKVKENDVYDLASVTKLAATTLSLLKLYDEGKIDLTAKMHKYIPEFSVKDKRSIKVKQILSHCSGLRSWIPFYRSTFSENQVLNPAIYNSDSTAIFSVKVAKNLYIRGDYTDSIYKAIIDTPSYKQKKYRYSDLGFYYLPKVIEKQSGKAIDLYTKGEFFSKLGMDHTFYNPLLFVDKNRIVPSEDDRVFRGQVIQGYVHDPGAAMLGGVSGHAGLFSNANDLAKLGQMFLNGGVYGGQTFFKQKTLEVFNTAYFKRKGNRRALGFDKPALKIGDPGPTCQSASQQSFGHSGFTGTYFWVDPENQSIYIFLSNRTFPDQENNKLVKFDIRTKIQQAFYDVFEQKNL